MRAHRLLIAGMRGGGGKTLVSVGLVAAWRARGLAVAPFKKGPDYLDAAWLACAAGRPCRNLDLFLMERDALRRSFATGAAAADACLIEGNRGLFDGGDAEGTVSTAELAKLLGCPVVLVVDCTKTTRTVAAEVLGCQRMDPDVPLRGVVLNRTGGARHADVARAAVESVTGLPVLGVLPRLRGDLLPERHMGLVPPDEHLQRDGAVREAGDVAERCMDVASLLRLAEDAPAFDAAEPRASSPAASSADGAATDPDAAVTIGVFRDAAFRFYYPENLEALAREGARLVEISPLADTCLPPVDGLYVGGGFPETFAAALANNGPFRNGLRRALRAGLPAYAECGGAVYLGESLVYGSRSYPMAGVLPASFAFRERPPGHGYVVLETVAENPYFPVGREVRAHEFHHTHLLPGTTGELSFVFRVRRGYGFDGEHDGLRVRNVLATYAHVHALGTTDWARAVVRAAAGHRSRSQDPVGVGN